MPKLRYVGAGGYLVGVPTRDLSDEEIADRGLDRSELLQSGLYQDEKPAEKGRRGAEVSDGSASA